MSVVEYGLANRKANTVGGREERPSKSLVPVADGFEVQLALFEQLDLASDLRAERDQILLQDRTDLAKLDENIEPAPIWVLFE